MRPPPEFQGPAPTDEDTYLALHEIVPDHTPGERRTVSAWPETFWLLADEIAARPDRTILPADSDQVSVLYDDWQEELNRADAMGEDDDPE